MSFWSNSTTFQKLAQIDGGISLGMTARQIAMNCGTKRDNVASLGRRHGRVFPAVNSGGGHESAGARRGGSVTRIIRARKHGASNMLMADAFTIFDPSEPEDMFDEVSA